MLRRKQVIVFARAPRYGGGKRRLARDVGNRRAFQFYQTNLKRLIRELYHGPWQLHVAVASEQDKHHCVFRQLPVIVQPQGDIGHRMSSVLSQFSDCSRLIVGSDIPGLESRHVSTALAVLSDHQLVFGPAPDGGFWAVGSNPIFAPDRRFMRGVRWSGPDSLKDTLNTVRPHVRVGHLASLADVDDGASLERYLRLSE